MVIIRNNKVFYLPIMKTVLTLSLVIIAVYAPLSVDAQLVYETNFRGEADKKVFITQFKGEADLIIYLTGYKGEARTKKGFWYLTEFKGEADMKVYFTPFKGEADLKVYFTPFKGEARKSIPK